jgi:hypothetical protein
MDGIMTNYYNDAIAPTNSAVPQMMPQILQILQNSGYNLGQLFPNGGAPQRPGVFDNMPGGNGFDGASAKLMQIGKNLQARREAAQNQHGDIKVTDPEHGHGGGAFAGITDNIFGSGPFAQLAGLFAPGLSHPGMLAPIPFAIGKKLF